MKGLTERQMAMLKASGPDDRTGEEGVGVELCTGADYAVAKSLEKRGLGHVEGPGGPASGMYWNNGSGLEVGIILKGGGLCLECSRASLDLQEGFCPRCYVSVD